MFFLFNKAKIISYTIAVFTVMVLFFIANYLPIGNGAVEVAANIKKQENVLNNN